MSSISSGLAGRERLVRYAPRWMKGGWLAHASLLAGVPARCPSIEPDPVESCGSAGGGSCNIELAPPSASPGSQYVTLRWSVAGPLDAFEVLVQASEGEPYAPVAAAVQRDSATLDRGPAWRLDWPSARVKVRGCAGVSCVESNEQPLAGVLQSSIAEVLADPGNMGLFSINIALSAEGNTLAVASSYDQPPAAAPELGAAVYVFQRGEDGRWRREMRAELERYNTGALLLSADGGTLVAGAPDDRSTCPGVSLTRESCVPGDVALLSGAVYIFARDGEREWRQQAFIKSELPLADLFLGTFGAGLDVVLSQDGSWLGVGSERSRGEQALDVDFYARDADGAWRHDSRLTSAELGTTDLAQAFPETQLIVTPPLALSGDRQAFASRVSGLIYPPDAEEPFAFDGVRVFRRNEIGWHLEADIRSPLGTRLPYRGEDGDGFGTSPVLDHDGRTLAVGAPLDHADATGSASAETYASGAVYVFERDDAGEWRQQAFLKAASVAARDEVGQRLALSADGRVLLAKAHGKAARAPGVRRAFIEEGLVPVPDDSWGASAYVFERGEEGWTHRAALIPPAPGLLDFGFSSIAMSADGRRIALGAIPYGPEPVLARSVFLY